MAHVTVNQYLQQFDSAIQEKDGDVAAELLSFNHPHVANPRLQQDRTEAAAIRIVGSPFDEIIVLHLRTVLSVANRDFYEACSTQIQLNQKDENWALPIMNVICLDLRVFANNAVKITSQNENKKPEELIEKAAEVLMGLFRVCAGDNRTSPEDSKRKGMLVLVNQLFKIYFKINKLHLCKPLIRAIEQSNIKEQSNIGQIVTYRYFVGRKAIFDSDYKTADECLTYAFEHCHVSSQKNKRQILIYLIPIKILLGYMPKAQLLRKYNLTQFEDVVQAVKAGNLAQLSKAMETHRTYFFSVYLILEKLKIITYRNLFKKVFSILKTYQIPLDSFLTSLKYAGVEDVDLDEVECIVVNLIYEGKIKGYVSHQHQKLVVSKQNPFPALSSLTVVVN
ncbi:PCI domain-containing protein 2 [Chamberlinius hualienensis]